MTAALYLCNWQRMGHVFSRRSVNNLADVHPALRAVAHAALAISPIDFMVTEGRRSMHRQQALFRAGATRTLKSRHLSGHAIDLAPIVDGEVRWDWPLFHVLAEAMKQAAKAQGVKVVWGGDWRTFKDGPHFELCAKAYPA